MEVIGLLGDMTWFQTWDSVRVLRPRVQYGGAAIVNLNDDPMPSMVQSQSFVPLQLVDPDDATASMFELWYSPDAGATWAPIDTNITSRDYAWSVPEEATDQALLGVVAWDEWGIMGSQVTNVFQIIHQTTGVDDGRARSFASWPAARSSPAGTA